MKQVQLSITPKPKNSAFAGGLSVSVTVVGGLLRMKPYRRHSSRMGPGSRHWTSI